MSVIEPGTIPPPSTKSNSGIPVRHRSSDSAVTSRRRTGAELGESVEEDEPNLPRPLLPAFPLRTTAGSSATEFHAAHASHRPTHLGCSWPHSVQRYTDLDLGMFV